MSGMNQDEIRARIEEISGRLKEIDTEYSGQALPDDARSEFERLTNERKELRRLDKELEARRAVLEEESKRESAIEAGFNVGARVGKPKGQEIYDLTTVRTSVTSPEAAQREIKERAKVAIEQGEYVASHLSKEEAQERADHLLRSADHEGKLALRMLQTGSKEYMRAFGKAIDGKPLTDSETRALSTADESGGYAIPFTLDPTVIHTSNHSVNPYRAVSRVVSVAGDNWQGLTSAGVSVSYAAEAAEAGDNSPSFKQPSIHPERAQAFIPYSIELGQDWSNLQSELTMMIQEGKDDLEAQKFSLGAGAESEEPQGVFIGGTASINTAGTAAFAVADLYKLEETLAPRYRPRAAFVAKRNAYNKIRQFDTQGGASLFVDNLRVGLGNQVPTPGQINQRLLDYPTFECSAAPYALESGGTILIFGDFSRYVIVDRVGMNVEIVPHLFGTVNNRPTGQRGLYAFWRNSAQVVDANAFVKLKAL